KVRRGEVLAHANPLAQPLNRLCARREAGARRPGPSVAGLTPAEEKRALGAARAALGVGVDPPDAFEGVALRAELAGVVDAVAGGRHAHPAPADGETGERLALVGLEELDPVAANGPLQGRLRRQGAGGADRPLGLVGELRAQVGDDLLVGARRQAALG